MRMPVPMAMMPLGIVRMTMHQRRVPMPMAMWFADRIARTMLVLVMLVVTVPMFMLHRFMNVVMIVSLGEM